MQVSREGVVRLSLGKLVTTTFGYECIDAGIEAIRAEHDLALLFRIVMQCQVIDDVADLSSDASAGLPSFLTATDSLSDSFELTCQATRFYASGRGMSSAACILPLRFALCTVSAMAILLITVCRWWQQIPYVEPAPECVYGP